MEISDGAIKKQNKRIRETVKTLTLTKSTMLYIIYKSESTGKIINIKQSEKLGTTTVDNLTFFSMVRTKSKSGGMLRRMMFHL